MYCVYRDKSTTDLFLFGNTTTIWGSLRDREVACSASDLQASNFVSCVWRAVLSHSSHHPQEVLLARFSLYVHKSGLKPDSFHLIYNNYLAKSIDIPKYIIILFYLVLALLVGNAARDMTNYDQPGGGGVGLR